MNVKASILGVVALLVVGPVSSHAAPRAQATVAKPSDHTLDERIEKRIHSDVSLKKYDIEVSVDGGVATLKGKVRSEATRAKATTLATIAGVTRVDNQLVVDPNAATGTMSTIKHEVKEGAEKTKEGAEKVVNKTKEGLSKTGEVMTDAWVTTRVHQKFMGEDLLKDSDIDVDTSDHVVTLKGTVMSAAGRARAIAQAKKVEGVHRVVSHLTIGPKKS